MSHQRNAAETHGLRGTNPARLTAANVAQAILRSPSLLDRRPPANVIPPNDFDDAVVHAGLQPRAFDWV